MANATTPTLNALRPLAVVRANATTTTLLAPVASAVVMANATTTTLLACVALAVVRANATTTTLLAIVPSAVVRANATTPTLNALRPLPIMVAKVQLFKNVRASVGAIQGSPRTCLPQHPPTGSMATMRNQGIYSSMSGMFPEPGGADTFGAVGAFQHDNLLRGLIDCWQAPDALRWAKHAINGGRPILVCLAFSLKSSGASSDAFRFFGSLCGASATSNS